MAIALEKKTSQAPGPPGLPVVGSALDLLRDILGTTLNGQRRYGDVVRYVAGPPGPLRVIAYGITHPDGVQQVLAGTGNRYSKQDAAYNELRNLVGNGLLTSEGEVWQRQKRMVQPLFTHKRVAGYVDMMSQESAELVERWKRLRGKDGTVDLHSELTRFSLRVVCRALFGTDVDQIVPVLKDNVPYLSRKAFTRSISPVHIPPHWPTPGNRHTDRSLREVYAVVDDLIASRRANPTDGDDLLSLLLGSQDPEGGKGLTDTEVRDQVLIFLLAGHETTATSLTFTMHLLGLHPTEQQKVRDEATRVLDGRLPKVEDTRELAYTNMAVKEAMRIYPAVYVIPRLVEKTDEIGGYLIPSGAVATVSPWVTHRHPDFWEDPERFDPERFTPDKERARHRYAYFPFGGGPRACIGQYFSMLESIIATAVLVRAFDFTSPPGPVKLFTGITLRPHQPMHCRIEPLD
ncbi:MAG TPA: cytochrome P450 [Actinomycetota bacterium]|nr:cytochrome P450 [Actinomycetota bacterium]